MTTVRALFDILDGMSSDMFFLAIGIIFVLLIATERFYIKKGDIEVYQPPNPPRRRKKGDDPPSDPKRFRD